MPALKERRMTDVDVLRHLVATLAYRAAKVIRDVPPEFPHASVSPATRRPVLIVAHIADLRAWALSLADGRSEWKAAASDDWQAEIQRFFTGLEALDQRLAASAPSAESIEKLIQGPLADALTHVGQIAMLRGMAGAAVRPESYARAQVVRGRVGLDQAPPAFEFDGDASVRR
jgi:hypothetical protein